MLITEVIKIFLESRKRGTTGARRRCRPATIKIYEDNLGLLQSVLVGAGVTDYKGLRRGHIATLLEWLDEREKSGQWSRARVLQFLRCARTLFKFVDADEDCQDEGLKGLQRYLPVIEAGPAKLFIPTISEMKAFRNAYNVSDKWELRDYIVTSLIMNNGMRIGEVCNLKIQDVQLDDGTLIADGKTGPRIVPVTKDVVLLLRMWLRKRPGIHPDSPFMFISKRSPQMSVQGFGQSFRKHRIKHGLAEITPHTLRHAFCTYYIRSGGNAFKLQNVVGHKDLKTTRNYIHLAEVGSVQAREELESVNLLKQDSDLKVRITRRS